MSDADHTLKLDIKDLGINPTTQTISIPIKRPVLVVLQGQPLGLALQLEKEKVNIGRGSTCDIVLRDDIASRTHAEIYRLETSDNCSEYFIKDLGSTNGTYLNGTLLLDAQMLQDGDKIKVGKHLMKFALLDEYEAEFQEKLHQITQTDELTGLRSRRSLFADLDRLVSEAIRTRDPNGINVIMLDLDFFKRVNDGRGHLIGSQTIRDVGHIIRDEVGSAECAARYGGEEYLAYNIGKPESGFEIAERIRRKVEATEFQGSTTDPTQIMRVTISAGVASYPKDGNTALDLVQKADQALYRAKASGRNQT